MSVKIVILDYGMGNLNSVKKKLSKINCDPLISNSSNDLSSADKIILPGVGHFQKAMSNLKQLNLIDALQEFALVKKKTNTWNLPGHAAVRR